MWMGPAAASSCRSARRSWSGISRCRGSNRSVPPGTSSASPRWAAAGSSGDRPEDLPKDLIFDVNYLGGNMPTLALNFSAPADKSWRSITNFVRLGREGLQKIHAACYRTACLPLRGHRASGPLRGDLRRQPGRRSHPRHVLVHPRRSGPRLSRLYDLADRLRERGWQVPAYSMPAHRGEHDRAARAGPPGRRATTSPACSSKDLKACIEHLQKLPPGNVAPLPAAFHH